MLKGILVAALLVLATSADAQIYDANGRQIVFSTDGSGAFNTIVDSGTLTCEISQVGTDNDVDIASFATSILVEDGTGPLTVDGTVAVGAGSADIGEVHIADSAGNQIDSATAAPTSAARGLVVRQVGPCKNELKTVVSIDIVTATTVLLATGVGGQHVYICSLAIITAGANNVAFVAGTGATCGTSTAGMAGGATAAEGFNFPANGGLTFGNGEATVMSTNVVGGATGDSVCVITSAATQLSGVLSYVIE